MIMDDTPRTNAAIVEVCPTCQILLAINRDMATELERDNEIALRLMRERDGLAKALESLMDCISETRGKPAYDAVAAAREAIESVRKSP